MTSPTAASSGRSAAASTADRLLKIWLAYGAWCACCGWIFSALGQLNSVAYGVTTAISLIGAAILLWRSKPGLPHILVRRFFHPLPLIYLLLLLGSIVGGLLYAPNNYDMLTYRLPRMLNWLAEGRWHWIHGYIDRMNYSGCGWEWMAFPLLLLTRSTSLFFLINIVSYLLLPGLFFSFLKSLGVSGRMAWTWMWLLPAGLNFVMQAGGASNDTVSAVYLLAALFFAFRARRSGQAADVFWSMIAAALLTSCKASDLPLALPCAVALVPTLPILRRHLPATAGVLCIAVLSSLLPTLILNYEYTRDWAGAPGDPGRLKIHNPVAGLLGNSLQLGVANLQPPVMPLAGKWNEISPRLLSGSVARLLARDFPRFTLHMNELPQEEASGLGLGLTAMAIVSLLAIGWWRWRPATDAGASADLPQGKPFAMTWPILIAGLLALLVFMAMLGSEAAARLASPYYPFVIALLVLHPVNQLLTRQRWWQACSVLASLAVLPGLILTPSRPLFPAVKWTSALEDHHPNSQSIHRAAMVYQVYSDRAENLAPLRKYIPVDQHLIGIVGTLDTSESPLWEPIGTRQVVEITPQDAPESIKARGIRFVVLGTDGLKEQHSSIDRFLVKFGGQIVGLEAITIKVTEGPEQWFVVDLAGLPVNPRSGKTEG